MSPTVHTQRSDKLRIYRAVPTGSGRARSQATWIRALDDVSEYATLRADAAQNLRTVAWAIARYADWKTLVARPGWDLLTELTQLSRSTIQRALRRLRDWGLLGIVESGSTWRIRGGRRDDEGGNRGGEYVLCIPAQQPVDKSDSPSLGSRREPVKPHASARENAPAERPRHWPMHQPPRTRGQRLAATQRLQQQAPVLARIPDRQLRSVLKPWFELGWTPAQVLYALDHAPDGQAHWHTADVRHVPGWIRSRLGAWDGHTPAGQLGAGRSTDLDARQVAQLPAAGARSTADVAEHASQARSLLAATLEKLSSKKPAPVGLGINLPAGDGQTVATAVEDHMPQTSGDGGDWLLRNAARRAEPDLMTAFGGLGASA